MRPYYARIELDDPYAGHWMELDGTIPFQLYQAAWRDPDARHEFLRRAIRRWSLDDPPPAVDVASLSRCPWDWPDIALHRFAEAFPVSADEELEILKRTGIGMSSRSMPELEKLSLCERLHIPYAPTYADLGAGETLRLIRMLNIQAQIKADMKAPED